jgi:hypothetical protein
MSSYAVLLRHFFADLLRTDAASDEDSYKAWLIQILALILAASWYIPANLHARYTELHRLGNTRLYFETYASDCLSALLLLALLTGLITVIEWRALFPSRCDHLVLTPLPLTRIQLFAAKLGALVLFVGIAAGSMSLITGVALPGIASGPLEPRPQYLRMAAFALAALGTCAFTFLGLLSIQGLFMAVLPVRWFERASFVVQVLLGVTLVCGFPLFPYFPARELIRGQSPWMDRIPPAWFWGAAERMIGGPSTWLDHLTRHAESGLAIALSLASLTYLVSYLQYSRHALESPARSRAKLIDIPALLARIFPTQPSRATAEFVLKTLARAREQKMALLLIFGIGVALVIESSTYLALHPPRRAALLAREQASIGIPLTLSFFALLGLRRAFRMPEELPANWLFRFLEDPAARQSQLNTVTSCFLLIGGLPLLLLAAPLEITFFHERAIWVLLAQAAVMFTFSRYLLKEWRAIPFTVAQNPGRRHFIQSVVIHLTELIIYALMVPSWIYRGLSNPVWFAVLAALLGFINLYLHRIGKPDAEAPLEFAEPVARAVEALRLLPE